MKARDIMTSPVHTIGEDETLSTAAKMLLESKISALPVVNKHGDLVGILTHTDFFIHPKFIPGADSSVFKLLGEWVSPDSFEQVSRSVAPRSVKSVMRREVTTVSEDTDVKAIVELMLRHDVNRLPVVKDKKVVGIITRHDFLKLLSQQSADTR